MPAGTFDYFDGVALVWLIIGLLRGRKQGMSQELLPTFQWIGIVVLGGLFYRPLALFIRQYAPFDPLWANIFAYILIGFGVHLVYLWVKRAVGEKLVGSDLFGRSEYYLGMLAGVIRFACILIAFCALMNSRIVTQAELARTEKLQADNLSDIRLPTFGTVQQDVLFKSFTGHLVMDNLQPVLIASTTPTPKKKSDTIAQRNEHLIDEVLTGGKK